MLKYTGKTNELFTRLLINLALASSDYRDAAQITLLDPMAGKGTTLLEGAALGYDVYGIEIGEKVTAELYHFFKKYLERERLKHSAKESKTSGPNRTFTAKRYTFRYARNKEAAKADGERILEILAGSGEYASQFLGKSSVHLLVADLPYGVQHGNVTREGGAFTRNPESLLRDCLPGWRQVLKKGGAMALSWNTHLFPRSKMAALLEAHGFTVMESAPYLAFSHRVDQSIQRDLVVALKPE